MWRNLWHVVRPQDGQRGRERERGETESERSQVWTLQHYLVWMRARIRMPRRSAAQRSAAQHGKIIDTLPPLSLSWISLSLSTAPASGGPTERPSTLRRSLGLARFLFLLRFVFSNDVILHDYITYFGRAIHSIGLHWIIPVCNVSHSTLPIIITLSHSIHHISYITHHNISAYIYNYIYIYICMYVCMYIYLSLSLSIYIYIYIYICPIQHNILQVEQQETSAGKLGRGHPCPSSRRCTPFMFSFFCFYIFFFMFFFFLCVFFISS